MKVLNHLSALATILIIVLQITSAIDPISLGTLVVTGAGIADQIIGKALRVGYFLRVTF